MRSASTWTEEEARQTLKTILNKTCGTKKEIIQAESRLIQDLEVDSLGMLEAIIEAEEAFDISIDAGELSPNTTFGDLMDLLKNKEVFLS